MFDVLIFYELTNDALMFLIFYESTNDACLLLFMKEATLIPALIPGLDQRASLSHRLLCSEREVCCVFFNLINFRRINWGVTDVFLKLFCYFCLVGESRC